MRMARTVLPRLAPLRRGGVLYFVAGESPAVARDASIVIGASASPREPLDASRQVPREAAALANATAGDSVGIRLR